jgi:tRNA threonylcarbamoyladenosine biosynthesis protein TsaB
MNTFILHLDTSTKICSVALSNNGEVVTYLDQTGTGFIHSEALTLMISEVLKNADVSLKNLSAISYSSGPGSYTGLRIGLSTAKGLCFALGLPLIAIPTHDILFQIACSSEIKKSYRILALLDARRTEVYMQAFDHNGKSIKPLHCALLDQTDVAPFLPAIVVGDSNLKAKEFWNASDIQWLDTALSAKFQAQIAFRAFEKRAFEDLAYCTPIYLKGANGALL